MSYPKQLLRLRPTRGLVLDTPSSEVGPDFYTTGSNVVFRNGFAQRIGGARAAYAQNTVDPVHHLMNARAPGGITESNFWLVFGDDEIQALETSNISDITGSALTPVTASWQWCATWLNNIPCFTNGLDAPRYWAGDVGTPAADLPNWPAGTICKSLFAFKHHLIALDIDGPSGHFESQILWSDAAAPGDVPATWTAAANNEAGDDILAETPGPALCGISLLDTGLIFKRSSTYALNYVEGEDVFSTRLLDGTRGALTRRAVADVGGHALVVTDGDVMMTDGTNWQSLAQGRIRDHIFGQLDQDSYEMLFVVFDRARGEARIYYPTTGNSFCNECVVYHVASDAFSVLPAEDVSHAAVGVINDLSPDESWDVDSEVWDDDTSAWNSANFSLANEQLLVAQNSDVLTLENAGASVAVDALLSKHDMSMGAPERFKFVRRVHVRTNGTPGTLYVRVGSRATAAGSITWGAEVALAPAAPFVNCRAQGRFISVDVRSEDEDQWLIAGIDIEYELRGYV